jgi:hypothetical protein
MYAKNLQTLIKHLMDDGKIELNFEDEITKGATITHGGKVVHEATAKALGIEVAPPPAPPPAAEPEPAQTTADATETAPSAETKDR